MTKIIYKAIKSSKKIQFYVYIKNYLKKSIKLILYIFWKIQLKRHFILFSQQFHSLIFSLRNNFRNKYLYKYKTNLHLSQVRSLNQINTQQINYINNVKLIGGSSVFIKNDEAYYPEPIDVNLDILPEEYRGFFKYNTEQKKIEFLYQDVYSITLNGITLNLMGGVANNYAHWLSEILPRLFFTLQSSKLDELTVLVNENTHKNLFSTIEKLLFHNNITKAKIIEVSNGILLNVKNLINVSNIGYCQFSPRFSNSVPYLFLNPILIRKMALQLANGIAPKNCKKIYLERTSNSRSILNHYDVKLLLEKYGYTSINTDNLSFDDQVSFFKGAEVIIGPTGAAFANCIFCDDRASIYILTTTNENHLLSYWPTFLDSDRLNINYLRQTNYDVSQGTSASFEVNLNSLLTIIR